LILETANPPQGGGAKPWVRLGGSPGYRKEQQMSKLGHWVVDFLKREDGPTAVEYAVMLALIIVVCITAITTLGTNANKTFTSVGNSIGSTSGS
jgi:pilus assembly protein Flp/PilA